MEGLTKSFGYQPVLKGVELKIRWGDFITIFGPNGAGKTTLLQVLATLLRPSSGRAKVAGLDLARQAREIRRRIGVVSHDTFLYDDLTAYENLRFYGRMYEVPHLEERIAQVISQVGLEAQLHHRVRTLSHGMQKRLAIARAIIHSPSVLFLDEPESGLDQEALGRLMAVPDSLGEGRTIIMTTHNIERGLLMGNRVAILAKGRIAYEGPSQEQAGFAQLYHQLTGTK